AEPPPAEPPPAELFDAPPPDVAPADAVPPDVMPPAVESPSIEPTPPPRPQAEAPQREGASTAQIIELSRRARRWRATPLATAALAAAFAGLVVVREVRPELMPDPLQPRVVEKQVEVVKTVEVPSPKAAQYVAVLQRDAESPAFLLTFDLEKRTLTVRTV